MLGAEDRPMRILWRNCPFLQIRLHFCIRWVPSNCIRWVPSNCTFACMNSGSHTWEWCTCRLWATAVPMHVFYISNFSSDWFPILFIAIWITLVCWMIWWNRSFQLCAMQTFFLFHVCCYFNLSATFLFVCKLSVWMFASAHDYWTTMHLCICGSSFYAEVSWYQNLIHCVHCELTSFDVPPICIVCGSLTYDGVLWHWWFHWHYTSAQSVPIFYNRKVKSSW